MCEHISYCIVYDYKSKSYFAQKIMRMRASCGMFVNNLVLIVYNYCIHMI